MRVMRRGDRLWWRAGLGAGASPAILGMSYWLTRDELFEELKVKVVSMAQDTTAWLRWRKKGIGASESAAILGLNPWSSREDVRLDKLTPDKVDGGNEHTRRGKRLEPEARAMYERIMGWSMTPICCVHDDHDFIRASLDGIRDDNRLILEAKAPSQRWHEHVLADGVPDWYYCQVQHQMLVTGAPMAHFVSYCPRHKARPYKMLPVKADPEFQRLLLRELTAFWSEVEAAVEAPPKPRRRRVPKTT